VSLDKRFFLYIFIMPLVLILMLTFPTSAQAPDGESLFKTNCSTCHTIGMGTLIGPDLVKIEQRREKAWIKNFIRSSQTMINQGDPDAVAIYETFNKLLMPDQVTITDDQVDAILTYIGSAGTGISSQEKISIGSGQKNHLEGNQPSMGKAPDTDREDIEKGRALFSGKVLLNRGGPACIACHNVTEDKGETGGKFAPDLTNVYSKIDEKTIMDLATAPRYPSMQQAYVNKPIAPEEALQLAAYLKYAGTEGSYQRERDQRAAELLKRFNRNSPK